MSIRDFEQELTVAGGHVLTAAVLDAALYGARPYDCKAAGVNVALGEPLTVLMQILSLEVDDVTSMDVDLITDTDGAGAGAVKLVGKTFLQAALQPADGIQVVGVVPPGTAVKRYLTARITPTGGSAPENAALCKVWFVKGSDMVDYNAGTNVVAVP